eukprot:scaffold15555_cov180-Amphora_coffeaeformis.AAC.6
MASMGAGEWVDCEDYGFGSVFDHMTQKIKCYKFGSKNHRAGVLGNQQDGLSDNYWDLLLGMHPKLPFLPVVAILGGIIPQGCL